MTVLGLKLLWDKGNTFSKYVIAGEMAITQVFGGDQNMSWLTFSNALKEQNATGEMSDGSKEQMLEDKKSALEWKTRS